LAANEVYQHNSSSYAEKLSQKIKTINVKGRKYLHSILCNIQHSLFSMIWKSNQFVNGKRLNIQKKV